MFFAFFDRIYADVSRLARDVHLRTKNGGLETDVLCLCVRLELASEERRCLDGQSLQFNSALKT